MGGNLGGRQLHRWTGKVDFLSITFIKSVNYITCNIIEFLINKVLDVKTARTLLIKDYANSLTNTDKLVLLLLREAAPTRLPLDVGCRRWPKKH